MAGIGPAALRERAGFPDRIGPQEKNDDRTADEQQRAGLKYPRIGACAVEYIAEQAWAHKGPNHKDAVQRRVGRRRGRPATRRPERGAR